MEAVFYESDQCKGQYNIRIAVFIATIVTLAFDCFKLFRTKRRMQEIESENRSLKKTILQNIDNTFIHILKNGNHSTYDHEE